MVVRMELWRLVAGTALVLSCGLGQAKGAEDANSAASKTEQQKISYSIGVQLVKVMKEQGLVADVDALMQGIKDGVAGKGATRQDGFTVQVRRQPMDSSKGLQAQSGKQPQDNSWKLSLKKPDPMTFDPAKDYFWVLDTNKGTIKIKLMPQVAPMHVTSTIFLTNKGFYDNLTFHRVIPEFMAQGGCPQGTGTGGPGYQYNSEIDPKVKHDRPYRLSMANTGRPGTDGSQFFITFKPTPWLDGKHTIFGDVTEGQDVVKKIEATGTPDDGKPREKLTIVKARIEEVTRQK
jgi:peptidyl-prolyl cis-trans isomerase B (cyclophilin B)